MFITITTGVLRPYRLVTYNRYGQQLSEVSHASLAALAVAARRNSWHLEQNMRDWFGPSGHAVAQQAFGPRGGTLPMDELLAHGARVRGLPSPWGRLAGYVRRGGPVPGIRKWRGGSWFQNVRTQSERRANALVVAEDGEVKARASRNGGNLPDSWDDKPRHRERNWKAQHKGCKSWDRPARHGQAK